MAMPYHTIKEKPAGPRAHFTSAGLSPNPNRNPNPNLNPLMLKPCRVDYARQASLEFLAVIR
ncbi:MAG: hypothetical protein V2A34_05570, partial [Lentisphaerota bacterium]